MRTLEQIQNAGKNSEIIFRKQNSMLYSLQKSEEKSVFQVHRTLGNQAVARLSRDKTNTVRRNENDSADKPSLAIFTGMPSDLSSLSTPDSTDRMIVSRDYEIIKKNSKRSSRRLPYNNNGWDGQRIARSLGQYDRIKATDSDSVRCVQATALVSYVLSGPEATAGYLSSITVMGIVENFGNFENIRRVKTALHVIEHVKSQIKNKEATYGDMYWAMEAVHDLFYDDRSGTIGEPAAVRSQIVPYSGFSRTMTSMDEWCNTPEELMAHADALKPGEQLMLNTWRVTFNSPPDNDEGLTVGINDKKNEDQSSFVPDMDMSRGKPDHSEINSGRDSIAGHQMLLYKDPANGHIKMYEPEITESGKHLFNITRNRRILKNMLFNDQPRFDTYDYVQLLGRISESGNVFENLNK